MSQVSEETIKQIFDALEKLSGNELRKKYAEFAEKYPQVLLGGKPADEQDPEDTNLPIPPLGVPDEGRVKNWGAKQDPNLWGIVATQNKKYGNFKVVDDKGVNVADGFSTEQKAHYFIEYYKQTHAVPTDNPGTKPDVPDDVTDDVPPSPSNPSTGFPIPTNYKTKGKIVTGFKWWGRHETGYASGGSGPSERWDCTELPNAMNILAGYEFNLGTKNGKRGSDNIDLKTNANGHNDKNGGWYIPFINWEENGSDGDAGVGKEYPHPSTSHLDFNVEGKGVKVKNIKDGNWHGFLCSKFLDTNRVPTIYLWYAENPTGDFSSYRLLGVSKDTGNMKPGPICNKIGMKGKEEQSLQIRMDEVPDCKIRNAFAVEIEVPTITT